MPEKQYIVAIDSGTQSIRAVLFDRAGNELAIEQAHYEPYFSLQPGWAEQDTADYWSKLCRVCKGLMAKITIDPREISGIGLTSQRNTVIPMDQDGNALWPGIIWLDQRTATNISPLTGMRKVICGVGGGARSDVAVQIAADMFNLPTARMATSEISALGAAIDAAGGLSDRGGSLPLPGDGPPNPGKSEIGRQRRRRNQRQSSNPPTPLNHQGGSGSSSVALPPALSCLTSRPKTPRDGRNLKCELVLPE